MRIVLRVYSWTLQIKTAKIVFGGQVKKLLVILVLGLLAFANQAKSEVIELKNCFTVQHSEWNATKFYNLKNRYEESTWSIII